jgi:hypothetical protein
MAALGGSHLRHSGDIGTQHKHALPPILRCTSSHILTSLTCLKFSVAHVSGDKVHDRNSETASQIGQSFARQKSLWRVRRQAWVLPHLRHLT